MDSAGNQNINRKWKDFLSEGITRGGFSTEDVVAIFLPLLQKLIAIHEEQKVLSIENPETIYEIDSILDFDSSKTIAIKQNSQALSKLVIETSKAFDVKAEKVIINDLDEESTKVEDVHILTDLTKPITKPVYLLNYESYEVKIGHHDELTDIYYLGLLLASFSLNMDLSEEDSLKKFVNNRTNLIYLNRQIHPVISNLIADMTEINRSKRARDLYQIVEKLQRYREIGETYNLNPEDIKGFETQSIDSKYDYILSKLKSRLFDSSRRNKLLYYSNNTKFLNLTVASVPSVLDHRRINPNDLFYWNDNVQSMISAGKEISLNKYLKIEDNPYIMPTLDRLRSENTRDKNEYGISQLRLVLAFFRWNNLKENKLERINTPLLLMPVELKKKKGIKDQYSLEMLSTQAEVNPILVYMLKDLYNIKLPDYINLEEVTLQEFCNDISRQIASTNSGIKLEYNSKPQIQLIHSLAKQTLTQFRKKLKKFADFATTFRNISHSYTRDNFIPFGLEIFKKKVEPKQSSLEFLLEISPQANINSVSGQSDSSIRNLYSLVDNEDNNDPYKWEFDVCTMILGNFNYKKMSLVRDYNAAIDNHLTNPIIEDLFSNEPQNVEQQIDKNVSPTSIFNVIKADPTQMYAIAKAQDNKSYIIQGPPGTGKSQTITNLIADFVARGKKVLFVCEKRAAIDVVYFRLSQNGLSNLCARIHDSQADKKSFIADLKECYETSLKSPNRFVELKAKRDKVAALIDTELSVIKRFNDAMLNVDERIGLPLKNLYTRLIELRKSHIDFNDLELEKMPDYQYWIEYGSIITELSRLLLELGEDERFAKHPFSQLKSEVILSENPLTIITESIKNLEEVVQNVHDKLETHNVPKSLYQTFRDLKVFMSNIKQLSFIYSNNLLALLDRNSVLSLELNKDTFELSQLNKELEAILEKNKNWVNKFAQSDLSTAIEIIKKNKNFISTIFNSKFANVRKALESSYDFSKHSVRPEYETVLDNLKQEYDKLKEIELAKLKYQSRYKTGEIIELQNSMELLFDKEKDSEHSDDIKYIKGNFDNMDLLSSLSHISEEFEKIESSIDAIFDNYEDKNLMQIVSDIQLLRQSVGILPDMLPSLTELLKTPENLVNTIAKHPLRPDEVESALAYKSLKEAYRYDRQLNVVEGGALEVRLRKLKTLIEELFSINADYINAVVQDKFIANVNLSSQSISTLNPTQYEFKKVYSEGRKILEHEFTKSIRFKPIRELVSKETSHVLQDLKPIWLMSPLSVSDTLPLDSNYFDVVIFDEASQITVEEGIPPIYRGNFAIIVGDQMQMPPTKFFSMSKDPEDIDVETLQTDEHEDLSVDAESLLVQASRKLPNVLLGWHYRSRYESLINFSNSAFYGSQLLTIPDKTINGTAKQEVIVNDSVQAQETYKSLYDRSISYHFIENGIYDKRTNQKEAEYISQLVKTLLTKNVEESIGIVAFSQEQQIEIENALSRLANEDDKFKVLLDKSYERVEDDQFVGLFIKNLENVQGDERDIMIISVCYGYDTKGKMLMNFGPINRQGGEKRLNVIFSRAKKHMAIISSIRHFDIKNEYNEGANYFRKFLEYAESISKGNFEIANIVLESLSKNTAYYQLQTDIVSKELASRLEELGYKVTENVGQSYFKCSLGIVDSKDEGKYLMGIMIDNDMHYNSKNILEQYLLRPDLLQAFGWNVVQVYTKDWYHNPDKVIQRIVKRLNGEPDEILPNVTEVTVKEAQSLTPQEVSSVIEIEKSLKPEEERVISDPAVVEASIKEDEKASINDKEDSGVKNENADGFIDPVIKGLVKPEEKTEMAKEVPSEPVSNGSSAENPLDLPYERYELIDGNHSKYWEVAPVGNKMYVRYGRIGTAGQMNLKIFKDESETLSYINKMKIEKINKGYKKVSN